MSEMNNIRSLYDVRADEIEDRINIMIRMLQDIKDPHQQHYISQALTALIAEKIDLQYKWGKIQ